MQKQLRHHMLVGKILVWHWCHSTTSRCRQLVFRQTVVRPVLLQMPCQGCSSSAADDLQNWASHWVYVRLALKFPLPHCFHFYSHQSSNRVPEDCRGWLCLVSLGKYLFGFFLPFSLSFLPSFLLYFLLVTFLHFRVLMAGLGRGEFLRALSGGDEESRRFVFAFPCV